VGGRTLPMKNLVDIMQGYGCQNIRTYIQSGNAVFKSEEKDPKALAENIGDGINQKFGYRPAILLIELSDLENAIEKCPFDHAAGKALHFYFLLSPSENPDLVTLTDLKADTEQFHLTSEVFYLFTPDGIGRSKLAAKVEKCLRVPVTARNWNTVRKLEAMANKINQE